MTVFFQKSFFYSIRKLYLRGFKITIEQKIWIPKFKN